MEDFTDVSSLVAVDGLVSQAVGRLQIEAKEGTRGEAGYPQGPALLVVSCWLKILRVKRRRRRRPKKHECVLLVCICQLHSESH